MSEHYVVSDANPPRNYVVYRYGTYGRKRWHSVARHSTLLAAASTASMGERLVVVDLLSGRMVADNGKMCSRVRPAGIPIIPPPEKYTD